MQCNICVKKIKARTEAMHQKNAARGRRKASGDAAQLAVPGSAWVDVPVGAWKQCPAVAVRSLGRSRATWPGRCAMLPRSLATSQSAGRRRAWSTPAEPGTSTDLTSPPSTLAEPGALPASAAPLGSCFSRQGRSQNPPNIRNTSDKLLLLRVHQAMSDMIHRQKCLWSLQCALARRVLQ